MDGERDEEGASFEGIWGEDAVMQMPPVGLEFRVQVDPRFYLGPLLRAVTRREGVFSDKAVSRFCAWALARHYEAWKGRRSPIDAARRAFLSKAVPSRQLRGRGHTLVASLDARCREETLARLLDARYQSFDRGKAMLFREALFDAVQAVLQDAEPSAEPESRDMSGVDAEEPDGAGGPPASEEE